MREPQDPILQTLVTWDIVFRGENLIFIGMELKVFIQNKKTKEDVTTTVFRYAKNSHMRKGVRLIKEGS